MSSEEDIEADHSPDSPKRPKEASLFTEGKPKHKLIRVLTVLAYILSVSMAAILLSIYYIFMWHDQQTKNAKLITLNEYSTEGYITRNLYLSNSSTEEYQEQDTASQKSNYHKIPSY